MLGIDRKFEKSAPIVAVVKTENNTFDCTNHSLSTLSCSNRLEQNHVFQLHKTFTFYPSPLPPVGTEPCLPTAQNVHFLPFPAPTGWYRTMSSNCTKRSLSTLLRSHQLVQNHVFQHTNKCSCISFIELTNRST